jgi:tetratricopeptide (TPR) repeat protein
VRAQWDLLGLGFDLLRRGEAVGAERCGRAALRFAPSDAGALNLTGLALHAQARNDEAAHVFARLLHAEGDNRAHWINYGTILRASGRHDEAQHAYRRAAALGEDSPDLWYNLGLLYLERGDAESARRELCRAHAARPDDPDIACQYAAACCETLHTDEGLGVMRAWHSLKPLDTERMARVATLLLSLGDGPAAEEALDQALHDPRPSDAARVQLALALERVNRVDAAQRMLAPLAEELPLQLGRDLLLARARLAQRAGRHEQAIALFGELARGETIERTHSHLFPLARSLDALGRHDEAYAALCEAHASQARWIRRAQPEIVRRKSDTLRITRHGVDPVDVAHWDHAGAPPAERSPVFIVAFPRSGTTLLEQMLDAHPALQSMDEQPFLQQAIAGLEQPGADYPERLAGLGPAELDAARAEYWRLVDSRVELRAGQRLVDKNPLNLLRLPAIVRLFPHASVIVALRHPADVLLSCWMQHFRPEFAWHCRDLSTLALAHQRAFDYWYAQSAVLQPRALEVRYERLVAEFEAQARRIVDFLQLPWDPAVLAPAEHAQRKGLITTPSYAQVVRPVHSESVERWRRYERWLAPLAAELRPLCDRWGYATPGQNSR